MLTKTSSLDVYFVIPFSIAYRLNQSWKPPFFMMTVLIVLLIGEGDPGSGASTLDESVPGQTHDHPQRRHLTQRRTVNYRQHSPLPHPSELLPRYPGCGGEPSGRHVGLCFSTLHFKLLTPVHVYSLRSVSVLPIWTPTTCLCWSPRAPCMCGGESVPVTRSWRLPSMWWLSWVEMHNLCPRAASQVGVLQSPT